MQYILSINLPFNIIKPTIVGWQPLSVEGCFFIELWFSNVGGKGDLTFEENAIYN